jgi:hypothetical protein
MAMGVRPDGKRTILGTRNSRSGLGRDGDVIAPGRDDMLVSGSHCMESKMLSSLPDRVRIHDHDAG